jgi:hypothetical protein
VTAQLPANHCVETYLMFANPFSAPRVRRRLRQALLANDWSKGPTPPHHAIVRAPGPDPIHLLLLGGGIATGYGTASHEVALAGHLARQIAQTSRRGVDMQVCVAPRLTISEASRLAGDTAANQYDAVILAIGVQDAIDGADPQWWATQTESLIGHFTRPASPGRVFVITVPPVTALLRFPRLSRNYVNHAVRLLNEQLDLLSTGRDDIVILPFDPDVAGTRGRQRGSDTYRSWATMIASPIVENFLPGALTEFAPVSEATRSEAVSALDIIDTAAEESYDEIVQLARRRFDAAIAIIGFMDVDREWFKAASGTDVTSHPRSDTFCDWTIRGRTPLMVPNAMTDDRFKTLRLVTDGGIRSYAGHPVLGPTGIPIGAICILDTKPRNFSAEDANFLRELAALVENLLLAPAGAR